MPYFLEYVTAASVGRVTMEGLDVSTLLSRATEAVRGLECLTAALLYSPDPTPSYGNGSVLATYTRAHGWTAPGEWPE